jgi:hypothetical protein
MLGSATVDENIGLVNNNFCRDLTGSVGATAFSLKVLVAILASMGHVGKMLRLMLGSTGRVVGGCFGTVGSCGRLVVTIGLVGIELVNETAEIDT